MSYNFKNIKEKKRKEKTLEQHLIAEAKRLGVVTYKFQSPSQPGVPDRILIGTGRTVFLELKAAGKTPTELQLHHMAKINNAGGYATWTSSKEFVDTLLLALSTGGQLPNKV